MAVYCPNCSRTIDETAQRCKHCGATLNPLDSFDMQYDPVIAPAVPSEPRPVEPTPAPYDPPSHDEPTPRRSDERRPPSREQPRSTRKPSQPARSDERGLRKAHAEDLPEIPPITRPEPTQPPRDRRTLGSAHGANATIMHEGVDVPRIKQAQVFLLQIYGKDKKWHSFCLVDGKGKKIGSGQGEAGFPELETLAPRHFRVTPAGRNKVEIEDLGSLNGVYRQISRPEPLADGAWFRLEKSVVRFRAGGSIQPTPALVRDGERLVCAELRPHGYLDFLYPDGRIGVVFPLTKRRTVLGQDRGDPSTAPDIHIPAELTSGQHAAIEFHDGRHHLENLSQTNGTYLRIHPAESVALKTEILAGSIKFRVVDEPG